MKSIFESFPISNEEYKELDEKYGHLAYFCGWQLARKNTKNNHQNDIEDFQQNLLLSILRAGSYYKRQIYIEKCLVIARQYATENPFICNILDELQNLWDNRTRHGANRQKYGEYQEKLLGKMIKSFVPKKHRPDKDAKLVIDAKFSTYCKQIVWNCQRSMGKQITREKPLRSSMVSLSEHSFLG